MIVWFKERDEEKIYRMARLNAMGNDSKSPLSCFYQLATVTLAVLSTPACDDELFCWKKDIGIFRIEGDDDSKPEKFGVETLERVVVGQRRR